MLAAICAEIWAFMPLTESSIDAHCGSVAASSTAKAIWPSSFLTACKSTATNLLWNGAEHYNRGAVSRTSVKKAGTLTGPGVPAYENTTQIAKLGAASLTHASRLPWPSMRYCPDMLKRMTSGRNIENSERSSGVPCSRFETWVYTSCTAIWLVLWRRRSSRKRRKSLERVEKWFLILLT